MRIFALPVCLLLLILTGSIFQKALNTDVSALDDAKVKNVRIVSFWWINPPPFIKGEPWGFDYWEKERVADERYNLRFLLLLSRNSVESRYSLLKEYFMQIDDDVVNSFLSYVKVNYSIRHLNIYEYNGSAAMNITLTSASYAKARDEILGFGVLTFKMNFVAECSNGIKYGIEMRYDGLIGETIITIWNGWVSLRELGKNLLTTDTPIWRTLAIIDSAIEDSVIELVEKLGPYKYYYEQGATRMVPPPFFSYFCRDGFTFPCILFVEDFESGGEDVKAAFLELCTYRTQKPVVETLRETWGASQIVAGFANSTFPYLEYMIIVSRTELPLRVVAQICELVREYSAADEHMNSMKQQLSEVSAILDTFVQKGEFSPFNPRLILHTSMMNNITNRIVSMQNYASLYGEFLRRNNSTGIKLHYFDVSESLDLPYSPVYAYSIEDISNATALSDFICREIVYNDNKSKDSYNKLTVLLSDIKGKQELALSLFHSSILQQIAMSLVGFNIGAVVVLRKRIFRKHYFLLSTTEKAEKELSTGQRYAKLPTYVRPIVAVMFAKALLPFQDLFTKDFVCSEQK